MPRCVIEKDIIKQLNNYFKSLKPFKGISKVMDTMIEADDTLIIETGHADTLQVFEIKVKEIQK